MTEVREQRPRQARLLEVGNPLTARFGAAFFRELPRVPGVYFFYDASDRLLYIGQSLDLRARVGSYRHVVPERHPRRTLRLVHRIARIELQPCGTAEEAVALEAALLLERKPPFNRAGVWQAPPWWLALETCEDHLLVRLERAPSAPDSIGPLPSAFRYAHAALCRCLLRLLRPSLRLSEFPVGWAGAVLPLKVTLPGCADMRHLLADFALRRDEALLALLAAALTPDSCAEEALTSEQLFWLGELETLARHATRKDPVTKPPQSASLRPAEPHEDLPLFPNWRDRE
jgi:hypothetical protein